MTTAFLYAGQGSQHAGMGLDLYEAYPAFARVIDEADAVLDFDLRQLMFEGPDETLSLTEYTQPAMVAFACGVTAVLAEHGIPLIDHRARQVRPGELGHWDLVVCMDDANVRSIERILGRADAGGPRPRVEKLLAFAPASLRPAPLRADGSARDVADPWYTGDYDTTYRDVRAGCEGLAASLFQSIP